MSRQQILKTTMQAVACALSLALPLGAAAQGFAGKTIRIMVPYAPGGQPDVAARTIGQKLSDLLGVPVIAENRPGAGGVLAAETVVRSAPDGTTLLVADSAIYSINPVINRKLPFDPLKDLAPITLAANAPILLAAHAGLKISTVGELIALAKSKPGLPYGSSGPGTGHHLAMELINVLGGVKMAHVPYKGASQSIPAVVAGDVAVAFGGLSSVVPHAKSGRVKVLAVSSGARTPLYPDAPTVAEAGIPGYEVNISIGFLAAGKTPKETVELLSREFNKALAAPEVRARVMPLGLDPVGTTPDKFAEAIRTELRQYGDLVKKAQLSLDN